jgi:hypothetical protein
MTFSKNDIITTDGYLNFCNENDICYIKTDYFYTGQINWRGQEHPSRIDDICVVGHSDYPVTNKISGNLKKVFCINNQSSDTNAFGIPLGITNDCEDSRLHSIYGNKDIMIDVMNMDITKNNLAYINFNVSTYPFERQTVLNLFLDKEWSYSGHIENTLEGRKKFLIDIKSSKFVFCPRGNGIDTHRLWEALYMGSYPIVKREIAHDLFDDLPILFIDDWREINEEFLIEKYEDMASREYNMEKLKLSYWLDFISKKIS